MKQLMILLTALITSGCVSFTPLELSNYKPTENSIGCDNNSTCKARNYASKVSEDYRSQVMKTYKDNNEYDSWILNLVTLGIGAEVSNVHSDVLKTAAITLGYQSSRKTYQSIPFQLQIYTNAITSTQCIYDNSKRLASGFKNKSKIDKIYKTLVLHRNTFNNNRALMDSMITTEALELVNYGTFKVSLDRAIDLSVKSFDVLDNSESTIVRSIQKVDITILKRFNGQLPDINEIANQLRQKISENIELEERGGVPSVSDTGVKAAALKKTKTAYYDLIKPLNEAIDLINALVELRVERYIKDANLVEACATSI
jgi:hypothetical protein